MNIGEEEEAIEMPIPVDPAKVPLREPVPLAVPVEQPVPAQVHMLFGGKSLTEIQSEIMNRIVEEARHG
jgi:hypothetical protein